MIISRKEKAQPCIFSDWLPYIAQDMIWFNVHDVGSYQGSVYGVAIYRGKIGIYEDYMVLGRRGCRYPVDKDIFEELHVEIDPK